jgi:hypothetical protein
MRHAESGYEKRPGRAVGLEAMLGLRVKLESAGMRKYLVYWVLAGNVAGLATLSWLTLSAPDPKGLRRV